MLRGTFTMSLEHQKLVPLNFVQLRNFNRQTNLSSVQSGVAKLLIDINYMHKNKVIMRLKIQHFINRSSLWLSSRNFIIIVCDLIIYLFIPEFLLLFIFIILLFHCFLKVVFHCFLKVVRNTENIKQQPMHNLKLMTLLMNR